MEPHFSIENCHKKYQSNFYLILGRGTTNAFFQANFFLLDFEVMAHEFYGGIFLVVFISLILGTSFKCSELKVGGQTKTLSVIWKKYLKSFKNVEV